jgi:hypothetical protein
VSGATVKIVVPRYGVVATVTTVANGSYTAGDLQPRSYDVEVYTGEQLRETKTGVFVYAGETATVQFELWGAAVKFEYVANVNGLDFHTVILSNSTVSSFAFNKDQKEISFNVTGQSGTEGFCNVTIPKDLLSSDFTVKVDETKVTPDPVVGSNSTHSFVYFSYGHSVHRVQIVGTTAAAAAGAGGFDVTPLVVGLVIVAVVLIAALLVMRRRKQRGGPPPPPPPPPPA